jgi:hypothetical protein
MTKTTSRGATRQASTPAPPPGGGTVQRLAYRPYAWSGADMNLLAGVATHVRDVQHDWRDLARLLH